MNTGSSYLWLTQTFCWARAGKGCPQKAFRIIGQIHPAFHRQPGCQRAPPSPGSEKSLPPRGNLKGGSLSIWVYGGVLKAPLGVIKSFLFCFCALNTKIISMLKMG